VWLPETMADVHAIEAMADTKAKYIENKCRITREVSELFKKLLQR